MRDLVPIDRVWVRLEAVERRLYKATTSSNDFVTEIAQHLLGGGKRYRPLLAQVTAELGPSDGDGPVRAGVAVELIHLGSLYHDDVIDEADARRGTASVNVNWSNTVAILAGDFLLARASEEAAPLGEEAVALLARTYASLCEGQVLELQLTGDLDHGPAEYYRVIEDKTASLIGAAARLGAMAGGASREAIEAATEWGHELGIVFQLADDVLDLVATDEYLGKPAGSDIGEGTFTLPVLHALEGPDGAELRELLAAAGSTSGGNQQRILEIVRSYDHVERVLAETEGRIAKAADAMAPIGDSDVTKVFRSLGEYLVERVAVARSM